MNKKFQRVIWCSHRIISCYLVECLSSLRWWYEHYEIISTSTGFYITGSNLQHKFLAHVYLLSPKHTVDFGCVPLHLKAREAYSFNMTHVPKVVPAIADS